MKLRRYLMLGLAMLSLGLFVYGCNGAPAETDADKKAKESTSSAPKPKEDAAGKPASNMEIPPPK